MALPRYHAYVRLLISGTPSRTQSLADGLYPATQASGKDLRVEPVEDTFQRVVRRDAARQAQEAPKPCGTLFGKKIDILPGVTVGDHATAGNDNDVQQAMVFSAADARVAKAGKVF